jgi:hypothetical protein
MLTEERRLSTAFIKVVKAGDRPLGVMKRPSRALSGRSP